MALEVLQLDVSFYLPLEAARVLTHMSGLLFPDFVRIGKVNVCRGISIRVMQVRLMHLVSLSVDDPWSLVFYVSF